MRTKHISQWIPAARALSSLATYRTTLPCPAAMVRGGGEWIHGAVRHEECATAGTADPRHDSGTYDGRSRGWMELCLRLYLHLHSLMVLPRLRTGRGCEGEEHLGDPLDQRVGKENRSRLGDHQLRQEEMQIKEKIVPLKVWFASPVNCCTPAGCFGASLSFNHSHECSGESID
ncbi:uncharacterized protein LOC133929729 isoform X1 [Phragmites australis]|uniref:uncharacterized protein LOC133929729 isoform X1 n=1 Tax=Phragmites australis TaxID=29695 RepID=UPI002D787BE9|nr:uncharacterized protein LOC133929729 isoform X1 [Phragmites australis]